MLSVKQQNVFFHAKVCSMHGHDLYVYNPIHLLLLVKMYSKTRTVVPGVLNCLL